MAKQTVGSSSTDRFTRPPSRGSGLLPLPSSSSTHPRNVAGSSSHPQQQKQQPQQQQQHAYQQQHYSTPHHSSSLQPPQLQPRKKSALCVGEGAGGGDLGGMNSEHKERRTGGGGHGQQPPPTPHKPPQGTSGDIVTATAIVHQHDLETLESCSRNPLLCLICNQVYKDPRVLSCYHSFCAKCLPGRIGDTKIVCPLCG